MSNILRNSIKNLAKIYFKFNKPKRNLKKYIPVSGKVLDEEDLCNLIDASLDMWLTTGRFNDEFENYLKTQCLKTTFNGIELETFSWYKKVLGLV